MYSVISLAHLSTPTISARLKYATSLFIKLTSISEVSTKIASAVDESLSKQQKEFFLRQQLAAIQAELSALHRPIPSTINSNSRNPSSWNRTNSTGNGGADWSEKVDGSAARSEDPISELDLDGDGEEEMGDVKKKIEAMEVGSEERRVGVAEWRRLRRIPQQSAEYGVVRTYVRTFGFYFCQMLDWLKLGEFTAGMAYVSPVALFHL